MPGIKPDPTLSVQGDSVVLISPLLLMRVRHVGVASRRCCTSTWRTTRPS
jgi:hypothetical protein